MDEAHKHIYVLIMAGGGGTRLWPLSRDGSPKQFLKLIQGKTLFRLSVERALKITVPKNIFIITNRKYQAPTQAESKGIPQENIIFEPIRRDTALAYATGALYISHIDPLAVIVNLHADNLIKPVSLFSQEAKYAAKIAFETNSILTIGIKPRFAHTGMGHIHVTRKVPNYKNTFIGDKFVEKPDLKTAEKYTQSGYYYWNSGMYVWPAKLLLELLKKHSPKTVSMFAKLGDSIGSDKEKQILGMVYQMAPSISIDYALSEKLRKFTCFVGQFDWTDVGDWKEVWNNLDQDQVGNVIVGPKGRGEYVGVNSKNNLLFLDKQLITTVGLENMLVVDTPDAILICPRDDAQSVKKIVEILKEQKLTKYL